MMEAELYFADTPISNHLKSLPPDIMMDTNASKRFSHNQYRSHKKNEWLVVAPETKVSNKLACHNMSPPTTWRTPLVA